MSRLLVSLLFAGVLLGAAPLHAKELKAYEGPALPDFSLTDLQGQAHRLSDYKGQVVLVNFWATWCPPCVHEMPSIQRLKEKLTGQPFEVLAVDMGQTKGAIEAFLKKLKFTPTFTILLDGDGQVVQQWKVFAAPTTFILGPDGRIRYALFGGMEWDRPDVVKTIRGLLPAE